MRADHSLAAGRSRRLTLGAVLLAGFALATQAMPPAPVVVRSGTAHEMLFDLSFDGTRGLAVGSYNFV